MEQRVSPNRRYGRALAAVGTTITNLACRECGRTVEVEGQAVERWAEQVAADHGFTAVTHHLKVFGRCGSCAGAGQAASTVE